MKSGERIPRLELTQLEPGLAERLRPRVERLGYLGEFFRCAGHQPGPLAAFVDFTEALKRALPDDLGEVVALTVATRLGNVYERNQHERLASKLGFADDWIRAARGPEAAGGPESGSDAGAGGAGSPLSGAQSRVQALTLAMLDRDGRDVDAELGAVIDAIGAVDAVAVLLLVGRTVTHALVVNALGLEPPVASIFAAAESP